MSGIVGLWNLDGKPLDPFVLSAMSATLGHRGADGEDRRVLGAFGMAHQHFWVTPEEAGERQPLANAGCIFAMDGRLDNRDELLPALSLSRSVSDASCALAAYEVWDDTFPERLNGDFALAIFDERQQRLLLARDAMGIRPLYFFRSERLFAFASEIKALLAHPDIPARPDDEGIADFLLISSRPIDRQDITCFAGISAVVPGHSVMMTPGRFVVRRYWDFDTGRSIRMRSVGEYAEALRERFAQAVRRRIRSAYPVAVSVSGGLDSSSIFCQASTLLRSDGVSCPGLVGISYMGAEGTVADESRYVLEIERKCGARIERFALDPLAGLVRDATRQIRTTEAPQIDYMWGITSELNRRVAARGSRLLLTGHWGDQVLFSSGYLVDLFRRLAWWKIGRHLRQYARWFGPDEARVLSRRFIVDIGRHHLPRRFVPPFKWIRRRLFGVERQRPWFSDRFLRRALRSADRPATLGEGFHSAQARSIYLGARSKYYVHCLEWHNKIGALQGHDAAFPFLDRDLLAFLMAIPGEVQNWNGVPRGLMREAMRHVLPEAIRVRASKADFSQVVNRGVAQDVSGVRQTLSSDSLGVQLGYLDADRLGPALEGLSMALEGPDCVSGWDLADVFGLEVWLQVFFHSHSGTAASTAPLVQEKAG